jgi:hypothetical protein
MTLISQPGSDYQLTTITIDAGHARDITLMLASAAAVLDDLAAGAGPDAARQAAACLREASSPYNLPALARALDEVTTWLDHALRHAASQVIPPPGL